MVNKKGIQEEKNPLKYFNFFIAWVSDAFVTSTLITFGYFCFSFEKVNFPILIFLFVSLLWSYSTPGRKLRNTNLVFQWLLIFFEIQGCNGYFSQLFTNYASQCQGQPRDKQGQAGTRQGQAGSNRDIPFLSLLVPMCSCLSLLVPACPCLSLSVPVCPCLSLSVPVCPCMSQVTWESLVRVVEVEVEVRLHNRLSTKH